MFQGKDTYGFVIFFKGTVMLEWHYLIELWYFEGNGMANVEMDVNVSKYLDASREAG